MVEYTELAQSLKDNEAFQKALDLIEKAAIGTLCAVSPDDKNTIIKAQAEVAVVGEIRSNLEGFIRSAAAAQKKPGIA